MIVKTFFVFFGGEKEGKNKVQSAPFYHLDVRLISDRIMAIY